MKTATLTIISIILLGACGQLKNVSPEQMSQVGQEQLDCSLQLCFTLTFHFSSREINRNHDGRID